MSPQNHFSAKHYDSEATGPFSFLNPTVRRKPLPALEETELEKKNSQDTLQGEVNGGDEKTAQKQRHKKGDELSASDVHHKWTARNNRKGRHTLAVTPAIDQDAKYKTPPSTSTIKASIKGIVRMFTTYPYWDVSYLVAIVFTLGSIIWCVNAFFVWLPLVRPSTEFHNEILTAGGITAFLGATVFEFGSILLMIEAVNENRSDCFGWNVERVMEEHGLLRLTADIDGCQHHHRNKKNFVGKGRAPTGAPSPNTTTESKDNPNSSSKRTWTWWPTWYELRTHYIREVGFLACAAQMFGATIFWISGFTALPGVNNKMSTPALNGAYWTPQVVGGTGFIVSGLLFMLETQQKWYLPAPKVLGWHIGLWNLIGAVGFTLCGALGYASSNSGIAYESSLATFWGSWAFLIGSVIQWFESLDKHPVDVEEGGGRVADSKPVA